MAQRHQPCDGTLPEEGDDAEMPDVSDRKRFKIQITPCAGAHVHDEPIATTPQFVQFPSIGLNGSRHLERSSHSLRAHSPLVPAPVAGRQGHYHRVARCDIAGTSQHRLDDFFRVQRGQHRPVDLVHGGERTELLLHAARDRVERRRELVELVAFARDTAQRWIEPRRDEPGIGLQPVESSGGFGAVCRRETAHRNDKFEKAGVAGCHR